MIDLKNAFLAAFKEGLTVFFSPFAGFWQAAGQARVRHEREEKHAPLAGS
jgi:hypothetical protein